MRGVANGGDDFLNTNGIKAIVSWMVGQNFQTDRFSGGFVF